LLSSDKYSMHIFGRQHTKEGFYVYAYLRESGTPYYIGKGIGKRATEKHSIPLPADRNRIIVIATELTKKYNLNITSTSSVVNHKQLRVGGWCLLTNT
jgi:hypothetical protein